MEQIAFYSENLSIVERRFLINKNFTILFNFF